MPSNKSFVQVIDTEINMANKENTKNEYFLKKPQTAF